MVTLWTHPASPLRVGRLEGEAEVEELIRLFEAVAVERHWKPNGAIRDSLDRSVHFALEVDGQLTGGLRLNAPRADGNLPCHSVWPQVSLRSGGRCAHVALLALEPRYRGEARLFWHLAAEMWRYCVGEGFTSIMVEASPRILPIYRRLGWPLKVVGNLRPHWGSPTYLCSLGIPEVAEALLRRSEVSTYYRQIVGQAFRVDLIEPEFVLSSDGAYGLCACAPA